MKDVIDEESVIRERRLRMALLEAPALVAQIRAKVTETAGRTERGVEVADERTPLLTAATDEADALYVLLIDWVLSWSKLLSIQPPVTAVVAWRGFQDSHKAQGYHDATLNGFKAGTTDSGAWALTQTLTTWLLLAEGRINTSELAATFQDEVAASVWESRIRHGMTSPLPVREAQAKECPACGRFEVRAEFFGGSFTAATLRGEFDIRGFYNAEDRRRGDSEAGRKILTAIDGVTIRCGGCGWTEKPNARAIVGWLA